MKDLRNLYMFAEAGRTLSTIRGKQAAERGHMFALDCGSWTWFTLMKLREKHRKNVL
jgi:hypothetical protein